MNLSILILIFRNRAQASSRITIFLIGTIVSISIWIITVYLQIEYYTFEEELLINTIIASISNVVILFGLILMSGFVKLLVEPKLSFSQTIMIVYLSSIVIGIRVISIYLANIDEEDYVNTVSMLADFLNFAVIISVIIFIQLDLRKLFNEDLSEKQKNQVKLVHRSILTGLTGVLPIIILSTFLGIDYLAISFSVIAISLFFLINAYLIDPRIAFILPYRTYLAIVVNKTGVLRYSKDFMGDRAMTSTMLISNTLTAITAAMSEFYNTEVSPSFIEFEEKLILFSLADNYFLAVFTDRDSALIRKAMDSTMKEIDEKFHEELHATSELVMLDLDEIFDKTFYFIY
jgi:hypothetical protein